MENIIFTQTKETVMTLEKTVTTVTGKLETVDDLGRKKLIKTSTHKSTDYHNLGFDIGRVA